MCILSIHGFWKKFKMVQILISLLLHAFGMDGWILVTFLNMCKFTFNNLNSLTSLTFPDVCWLTVHTGFCYKVKMVMLNSVLIIKYFNTVIQSKFTILCCHWANSSLISHLQFKCQNSKWFFLPKNLIMEL